MINYYSFGNTQTNKVGRAAGQVEYIVLKVCIDQYCHVPMISNGPSKFVNENLDHMVMGKLAWCSVIGENGHFVIEDNAQASASCTNVRILCVDIYSNKSKYVELNFSHIQY